MEAVGEDGREEADGGRSRTEVESARCSYSLVMDLTDRLCDSADEGLLWDWSIEIGDSALGELDACLPDDLTLARWDSDKIRSPAIVVMDVRGEEERGAASFSLFDDRGIGFIVRARFNPRRNGSTFSSPDSGTSSAASGRGDAADTGRGKADESNKETNKKTEIEGEDPGACATKRGLSGQ